MSHTLRPGHSVIVSTYERISLPASLGGIVFPPSRLSSNGILVANIGHIDPGFTGNLRFTIINMGGRDFPLERGKVEVGTLLLFKLSSTCNVAWNQRHQGAASKGEPDKREIDSLAKDFADIESRVGILTRAAVKREYWRFSLLAVIVPMLLGLAIAVWTIWFETGRSFVDRVEKHDQSIADMRVELGRLQIGADLRKDTVDRDLLRLRADMDSVKQKLSEQHGK